MITDHGHMKGVEFKDGWVLFVCSRCSRKAWLSLNGTIQVETIGDPFGLHLMRTDQEHVTEEVWKEVQHANEL